jgi:phenylacetate-coenzyme A ligase PaaK-like adenylate-forming protein
VNLPLDKMIQELNEFQPTILGGYFNALKVLAQKQEEGILEINPRTMTNCGEGINAKQKEYIERVFDAPMTNLYGFAECFILGFGKDEFDGIYLRDDICLVEVKEDHLLITNLVNKTEPLIRYKINDYVKLKEDKKKLYPFTLIDNIVGREEFVLWFENDIGEMDFIHPLIFTDFYVKGLHQLQIAITSKTTFEFRAVIDSTEKEQVKNKIREKLDIILKEKNFTNVIYTIKEYDEIPVDEKTGKFRLIINE